MEASFLLALRSLTMSLTASSIGRIVSVPRHQQHVRIDPVDMDAGSLEVCQTKGLASKSFRVRRRAHTSLRHASEH